MRGFCVVLLSLWAVPAAAFCGFYVAGGGAELFNNATQVALMRNGTRTVLSMQNNYQGPPEAFAMVVPVPVVLTKENVKTLPRGLFERLDKLSAPRLVEYWEQDPCYRPQPLMKDGPRAPMKKEMKASSGVGRIDFDDRVVVEAQFEVGEYEVVVLSAEDALGLERWLKKNGYNIPRGAEPLFRPYIQQGMKFFVAKVDATKVTFRDGMATLSPLRFHYDSEAFALPVRLGLINAKEQQDLIVHVLARGQRYEVANKPNATIPTNIDLVPSAKSEFGPFYASLFDRTQAKANGAVITEYAWDANTCDPCPSPALSLNELAALGLDVLDGATSTAIEPQIEVKNLTDLPATEQQYVTQAVTNVRSQSLSRQLRGLSWRGFVLTRLHVRYDRKSLGEDLVFRAAPPIAGGRESITAATGLEQGAVASSVNQFQGRYAVRYPWTGPITCTDPVRGRWGGNPAGGRSVSPLADAAFVPRGKDLATFAESPIGELSIKGRKPRAGAPMEVK